MYGGRYTIKFGQSVSPDDVYDDATIFIDEVLRNDIIEERTISGVGESEIESRDNISG